MTASTSRQPRQREHEPLLRSTITSLRLGMSRTAVLPVTNYSHHLDAAMRHMQDAERELLRWADANDIQIHEAMPT